MVRTSLMSEPQQLTAEDARSQEFPRVVKGYSASDVHSFCERAARTLDDKDTEQAELVKEITRLQNLLLQAGRDPAPDQMPTARHAAHILRAAQANSDEMLRQAREQAGQAVEEARREHDQIVERARQEAGDILAEAAVRAAAEHARIMAGAPAEARRQAGHYLALARSIGDGLRTDLEAMFAQVADWDRQACEGAPGVQA